MSFITKYTNPAWRARDVKKAKVAILVSLANSLPFRGLAELGFLVSPLALISVMVSASDSEAAVEALVEDLSLVPIFI